MNRPIANSTPCDARRSRRASKRAGVTVGILLLGLIFLSGFLALGVNSARLSQARTQLRSACQAAALAGAQELMDEGVLAGNPDQRDDVLMAREAARLYGRINPVDGRPIVLDPNKSNDPRGDVIACTVDPFGPVGQPPLLPALETEPVNTLRVTARLERNSFDRVSLWFGSMAGMPSADVAASAQATLDRRVAGFRPEPGVNVPVVPLVAEYEEWIRQSTAAANPGTNDRYAINYQTGEVVAGSDGIPEIVLRFSPIPAEVETVATENAGEIETAETESSGETEAAETESSQESTTGRVAALSLDDDGSNPWIWSTRTRDGLSRSDLASYGGEMVVRTGVLPMPVYATVPPELPWTLMDIAGANRAWPLGDPAAEGAMPTFDVVGFAAGRIVAVRLNETSSTPTWEVVVQPSTIVSSQAVTLPTMNANPWIGKLELTQ
jgi:hypothetical protein